MVLFAKRPQEDEEPSDGQDIVVGSHVVVLSGRHFPAFGAGDLGLVSRVDKEAQNCEVLFEGRSSAVPVALRHLRVHRWPTSPKAGRHGADRAGLGSGGGNSAAASAPEDGAWQPCSPRRYRDEPAQGPCEYMDSTAGFAAGLAAVSAVSSGAPAAGARGAAPRPPDAALGPECAGGGPLDFLAAGPAPCRQSLVAEPRAAAAWAHGGAPALRGRAAAGPSRQPAPVAAQPLCAVPDGNTTRPPSPRMAAPEEPPLVAFVAEPVAVQAASVPPQVQLVAGAPPHVQLVAGAPQAQPLASPQQHHQQQQWGPCSPSRQAVLPSGAPQVGVFSPPAAPGSPAAGGWKANRLEAMEARLARMEDEHRSEVSWLRHALEECVQSIGACAAAVDAVGMPEDHALLGVTTALRDAASLGQRVLGAGAGPCRAHGVGCARSTTPRPGRHVPVEVVGCGGALAASPPGTPGCWHAAPRPSHGEAFPGSGSRSSTPMPGAHHMQQLGAPLGPQPPGGCCASFPGWGALGAAAPQPLGSHPCLGPLGPPGTVPQLAPPAGILGGMAVCLGAPVPLAGAQLPGGPGGGPQASAAAPPAGAPAGAPHAGPLQAGAPVPSLAAGHAVPTFSQLPQ